jgi:hypothetical protein
MTVVSVDGRIDHRDVFLSEAQKKENHKLCACVSRAVGTVVLDTDDRPDTIRQLFPSGARRVTFGGDFRQNRGLHALHFDQQRLDPARD